MLDATLALTDLLAVCRRAFSAASISVSCRRRLTRARRVESPRPLALAAAARCLAEAGQHARVNLVSLRQLPQGTREVTHLTWVDHMDRQAGSQQRHGKLRLQPARRLEDDAVGTRCCICSTSSETADGSLATRQTSSGETQTSKWAFATSIPTNCSFSSSRRLSPALAQPCPMRAQGPINRSGSGRLLTWRPGSPAASDWTRGQWAYHDTLPLYHLSLDTRVRGGGRRLVVQPRPV